MRDEPVHPTNRGGRSIRTGPPTHCQPRKGFLPSPKYGVVVGGGDHGLGISRAEEPPTAPYLIDERTQDRAAVLDRQLVEPDVLLAATGISLNRESSSV
jgi:hypothetical protein